MNFPAPAAAWPTDAQERPPKRVKRTAGVIEKPELVEKPRTIGTYVEVILSPIPSDP